MTIKLWTIVSCLAGICASIILLFYPNYEGNEFPLFTDITTFVLFLPSYFLLLCAIVPLVIALLISNKVAKFSIILAVCAVAIVNSFQYTVFELIALKLFVIFLTLTPVFLFWVIVINVKARRIVNSTV